MYCDGRCIYLDSKKHKCTKKEERLTYMKIGTGGFSTTVHECKGYCKDVEVKK